MTDQTNTARDLTRDLRLEREAHQATAERLASLQRGLRKVRSELGREHARHDHTRLHLEQIVGLARNDLLPPFADFHHDDPERLANVEEQLAASERHVGRL